MSTNTYKTWIMKLDSGNYNFSFLDVNRDISDFVNNAENSEGIINAVKQNFMEKGIDLSLPADDTMIMRYFELLVQDGMLYIKSDDNDGLKVHSFKDLLTFAKTGLLSPDDFHDIIRFVKRHLDNLQYYVSSNR